MARVRIFHPKVTEFTHRKVRPLVIKTSQEIYRGAKVLVPRQERHLSGSGKPARGLPLTHTLEIRYLFLPDFIVSLVGSDSRYAATAHQGSRPHYINGHGKMLKFEWGRGNFLLKARGRRGQRFFYFRKVLHPGNKRPVRYLTTPMHLYGRMNGFRTVSNPVSRTRLP